MLRAAIIALAFGAGVTAAYLVGRDHHERPAALEKIPPAPPPAVSQPPSGPTLEEMLAAGRRARLQQAEAPRTPADRRRALAAALTARAARASASAPQRRRSWSPCPRSSRCRSCSRPSEIVHPRCGRPPGRGWPTWRAPTSATAPPPGPVGGRQGRVRGEDRGIEVRPL